MNSPSSKQDLDLLDDGYYLFTRRTTEAVWRGEGGGFSGAGASGAWDGGEAGALSGLEDFAKPKSVSDLGDIDEAAVFFLAFTVIAAVFGSAGYLIYQAPEILFEAGFEVVLAAGLVKQARKLKTEGWFYSVFKKTWWLCAIILVGSMLLGYAIKKECPAASSFGQYRELCLSKDKSWSNFFGH